MEYKKEFGANLRREDYVSSNQVLSKFIPKQS